MYLDMQLISNWIISGLIGLLFGIISAWVTHRYERKRDDISWEHEKVKLGQQFQQEKELMELQFRQKLSDYERGISQQERDAIRSTLTKGLENPEKEIRVLERSQSQIMRGGSYSVSTDSLRRVVDQIRKSNEGMQAAIRSVDASIQSLRSMQSPRIAKDIEMWDQIKSKLMSDLDSADQAVTIINKAVDDVEAIMSSR